MTGDDSQEQTVEGEEVASVAKVNGASMELRQRKEGGRFWCEGRHLSLKLGLWYHFERGYQVSGAEFSQKSAAEMTTTLDAETLAPYEAAPEVLAMATAQQTLVICHLRTWEKLALEPCQQVRQCQCQL